MKLCAAAAILALAVAGCGSGDDNGGGNSAGGGAPKASAPGITAKTVTVGGHFPLTGLCPSCQEKLTLIRKDLQ